MRFAAGSQPFAKLCDDQVILKRRFSPPKTNSVEANVSTYPQKWEGPVAAVIHSFVPGSAIGRGKATWSIGMRKRLGKDLGWRSRG